MKSQVITICLHLFVDALCVVCGFQFALMFVGWRFEKEVDGLRYVWHQEAQVRELFVLGVEWESEQED